MMNERIISIRKGNLLSQSLCRALNREQNLGKREKRDKVSQLLVSNLSHFKIRNSQSVIAICTKGWGSTIINWILSHTYLGLNFGSAIHLASVFLSIK